jgi:cell division protein FtsB
MRALAAVLAAFIVLLQYPLWLGKGGWLRVWDLDRQVTAQKAHNDQLARRNAALDAEVRDLKQGFEAVEERARSELGMVRPDEVYVQVIPPHGAAAAGANSSAHSAASGSAVASSAVPGPQSAKQ